MRAVMMVMRNPSLWKRRMAFTNPGMNVVGRSGHCAGTAVPSQSTMIVWTAVSPSARCLRAEPNWSHPFVDKSPGRIKLNDLARHELQWVVVQAHVLLDV